jgi:hypothetical protein
MGKIEVVDPQTGEVLEYDSRKTKILKPGVAYGANDIKNWSSRRAGGRGGVSDTRADKKQRKRALELSRLSGNPVKSFDGTIQYAKVPKKKKRKKFGKKTPYQLYRAARRGKLK